MTLGEKLHKLRRDNHYTQEQLSEILGVSRQAISKWESNTAYPETDKLIKLSELFDCSLDYLLKDKVTEERQPEPPAIPLFSRRPLRERKSERTILGLPAWHVGKHARGFLAVGLHAKGVIAVGLDARGLICVGAFSLGVLSFGLLSLGLVSIGLLALGGLACGCFSAGILSAGAVSLGIISQGAIAVGDFSVGALAIGKYFALGDHARAMIAIGDSEAVGSIFRKIGELGLGETETVKGLMQELVPSWLAWAGSLIARFL